MQITLVKLNSNTSLTTLLHLKFHYEHRETVKLEICHNKKTLSAIQRLSSLESIISPQISYPFFTSLRSFSIRKELNFHTLPAKGFETKGALKAE